MPKPRAKDGLTAKERKFSKEYLVDLKDGHIRIDRGSGGRQDVKSRVIGVVGAK